VWKKGAQASSRGEQNPGERRRKILSFATKCEGTAGDRNNQRGGLLQKGKNGLGNFEEGDGAERKVEMKIILLGRMGGGEKSKQGGESWKEGGGKKKKEPVSQNLGNHVGLGKRTVYPAEMKGVWGEYRVGCFPVGGGKEKKKKKKL